MAGGGGVTTKWVKSINEFLGTPSQQDYTSAPPPKTSQSPPTLVIWERNIPERNTKK